MKLLDVSIAANDTTLAHALAHGRIKQLRGDTETLFGQMRALEGKTSVRDGARMLEAHFGKLALLKSVTRLTGSRPKARWLVLDASVTGGSDMVATLVTVDKTGWAIHDLSVRITPHLVARLMQRTTKNSSLQLSAEVLRVHIFAVLPAMRGLPDGHTLTTASDSGALVWVPYDGGVRGVTWLGIESIRDAKIAKLCKEAGKDKVALHLMKANGEEIWATQEKKSAESAGGTTLTMKP